MYSANNGASAANGNCLDEVSILTRPGPPWKLGVSLASMMAGALE